MHRSVSILRISALFFSVFIVLAAATPSFASDTLEFLNGVNYKGNGKVIVHIKVDGKELSPPDHAYWGDNCNVDSKTKETGCGAPITPGKHVVEVQVEGSPRVKKEVTVRSEEMAMNWDLVPKDVHLWCIEVQEKDFHLASRQDCWKFEDDK